MKKGMSDVLSMIIGIVIGLVLLYVVIMGVIKPRIGGGGDVIANAAACGTIQGQTCIDAADFAKLCKGTEVPQTTSPCPEGKRCCYSDGGIV